MADEVMTRPHVQWNHLAEIAGIPEKGRERFRGEVSRLLEGVGEIKNTLRHFPAAKVAEPFERIAKLASYLEEALVQLRDRGLPHPKPGREKTLARLRGLPPPPSVQRDVFAIQWARETFLEWQLLTDCANANRDATEPGAAVDVITRHIEQVADLKRITEAVAAEARASLPARGRPKGSDGNADIFVGRLALIVFRAGGNVTAGDTGSFMALVDELRPHLPRKFMPEWVSTYQDRIVSARMESERIQTIKKTRRAP